MFNPSREGEGRRNGSEENEKQKSYKYLISSLSAFPLSAEDELREYEKASSEIFIYITEKFVANSLRPHMPALASLPQSREKSAESSVCL
jgi:hypothetical protein